jgi:hypothetical protein
MEKSNSRLAAFGWAPDVMQVSARARKQKQIGATLIVSQKRGNSKSLENRGKYKKARRK